MRSKITHVIFDVDGLLLNSESVYTALCAKILRSFGFTLTYDLKRKLMGRKPREAAAVLVSELSPSFTASEFTNIWDRNLTEDKWLKTSSMPGAERLILHLAEHAIPMAAATGCYSYELEQKLKYHPNIRNNLSHAVTAGDDPLVKHGKPKPDVFLEAASRFSHPPSDMRNVLVFEDSPLGVEAGLAAGMHVVWVPPAEEPDGAVPQTVPLSLSDRVLRLKSLFDFRPECFGLPPFPNE